MSWPLLVLLPLVGAAVGAVLAAAAVRLLFRPYQPRRIAGLTVQGWLPRRRVELARRAAEALEGELLAPETVAALARRLDWRAEIGRLVERALGRALGPLRRLPFGDELARRLKETLTAALVAELEARLPALAGRVRDRLD
ncbi:MAG TPA: hypothetical protein VNM66_05110, partial [Thermodesulfobacteriota bacterium]|nr:hypothetical protein [Thermodesulfobacteriota bacterium]